MIHSNMNKNETETTQDNLSDVIYDLPDDTSPAVMGDYLNEEYDDSNKWFVWGKWYRSTWWSGININRYWKLRCNTRIYYWKQNRAKSEYLWRGNRWILIWDIPSYDGRLCKW